MEKSRAIDADALIEKCGDWYVEEGTESGFVGTLKNLLATMPTVQPQSTTGQLNDSAQSTNLIDRQQALKALRKCQTYLYDARDPELKIELSSAEAAIKELPTIQPERKKGEWLPDNNNAYEMRFVCSCCKESEVVPTIGFTKYKTLWDFCPNCGADMRGEKDG